MGTAATHHAPICDPDVHALPPLYELEHGLAEAHAVDDIQHLAMSSL
jgi:hypothetical protein